MRTAKTPFNDKSQGVMIKNPGKDSGHARLQDSPKVLFGVTTGVVVKSFFDGMLSSLRTDGWTVSLLSTTEAKAQDFAAREGVAFIPIDTVRDPSPLADLRTLTDIVAALRSCRPDIAVWGTPKVGLIGVIASRICRIKSVYVPHGLRYQSESGLRRAVLKCLESASARLADSVVTVGHEVRSTMISDRIVGAQKIQVLGSGSANGVPEPTVIRDAREQLGVSEQSFVGAFVGRVTRDKGVSELLSAWARFHDINPDGVLLIAGMLEPDAQTGPLKRQLENAPGVRMLGHLEDLSTVYSAIDVLLLPSYREGLPTVVIEAGSYGVPCIVSNATGVSEPIVNGKTGLVVATGSVEDLYSSLDGLFQNRTRRTQMGLAAARHVRANFDRDLVQAHWREYLKSQLD